jgi:HlyD family secretion protein
LQFLASTIRIRLRKRRLSSYLGGIVAASRKSKRFWIWLGSGVTMVVLLLGYALAQMAKGPSIDKNKLSKVTRGDVARSVVATGKIQPITKVEVKS